MPGVFVIARDARGSLVHVRRRDDGECVGRIEVGLYEVLRALVLAERAAAAPEEEETIARAAVELSVRPDEGSECYEAVAVRPDRPVVGETVVAGKRRKDDGR